MDAAPTSMTSMAPWSYRRDLFGGLSGQFRKPAPIAGQDYPLILALHGGSFSSRYFDIPSFSLLDRAELLGLPILAPDRPGYGESLDLGPAGQTAQGNAEFLQDAVGEAWQRYRGQTRGIVIIGHATGAVIAMKLASRRLTWPLLGIALSGVGLRAPARSRDDISTFLDCENVLLPPAFKDELMFGPPGSFDARMPDASHVADTAAPRAELAEILMDWPHEARDMASRIKVPVHYRQAEFDRLWVVDHDEVAGFAALFSTSPFVDAAMIEGAGHCIDFHHSSPNFHFRQLGFAMRCAALHALEV